MLRYRRGAEPRKDTDTHAATETQPVIKQPTAAPLAECAAPDGQNRAPGSLVFGLVNVQSYSSATPAETGIFSRPLRQFAKRPLAEG